ncbi:MAG TPA: hypothetical protein V6C69_10170 [Trichormus sp.]
MVQQTKANDATASTSTDSAGSRIAKEIESGANAHAAEEISKLKQTNPAEYQKVLAATNKEVSSYNSAHNSHLPSIEIVGDHQVKLGNDSYSVGSKNGNTTTVTDAKGNVTEFKTSNGQETSITTDKNNKVRETDQYNADGSIKSETTYRSDGKTQTGNLQFKYDAKGTLASVDGTEYGADGKTVADKTHVEAHYDASGKVTSTDETKYKPDGTTVTAAAHTDSHYDATGRLTGTDSTEYGADGKTVTGHNHVDEHYDSSGTLTSEDEKSYQADGKTLKTTAHTEYDASRNMTTKSETSYQADGQTRSAVSSSEYDANGNETNLKTEFQDDGKTAKTASQTEYDADGEIKTQHEKTFNDEGKLIQRSDTADGQTTLTDIDAKTGKTTGYTRVDKDGTETRYAADGKTKTSETKHKYDANGQEVSSEETEYGADGKVTGYRDTQYDANGNTKTEASYTVGKDGKRISAETKSYEFDSDGSPKGYYDQKYDNNGKPTVRPFVEATDSH